MVTNLLIGLREGVEASLIVSVLVAYLVRSGRRDMLRWVWAGVAAAVVVSLAVWGLITFAASELGESGEAVFAGVMSIVAVGFVTWMILWMRRAARTMRRELDGKLSAALVAGPFAVFATAFLAVAREGVETAVFLWSAMRSTGTGVLPTAGALIGLGAAAVIGYLIYRGALRVNLSRFFTWTGVALIVIAAWVLSYGVHELGESGVVSEIEWLGPVLALAYAAVMLVLFFRRHTTPAVPAQPTAVTQDGPTDGAAPSVVELSPSERTSQNA